MSLLKQVKFGNSGLKVSPIIVGCMQYGSKEWSEWVEDDKTKIFGILKHCYDRGMRTFDTANVYSNGLSETLLGEFLKHYNIPRETVVIMSKLNFATDDKVSFETLKERSEELNLHFVNMSGLSRKNIMASAKESVRRLGTYIDVLQIHRADRDTPYEETMRALNDLVESGITRYIGASSMLATEFAEMQFTAEKYGWFKFINSQSCYNLLYREDERELMPFAKRHNIALTPWSPLQRGLLTRPVGIKTTRYDSDRQLEIRKMKNLKDSEIEIINRVEKLANDKNVTMAVIGLAWVIAKGCTPIAGLSSIARVDEAIKALDIKFTEEELQYLEEPYESRSYMY
ncbi:hypothetical protein Kpol_2000p109 [Vanderwaltozyma polyspora DSM 70294]|uniref:NADP-dependent oxidoreductase domain-containing protein n=1 Tax=Vanderwaltozyma polyspora (strain ATCC 22028 / DSM 70294 / BCRC 21397 / CBS 2163 / NBRC 10782 / NRRL Y-8283 / UCD 57-17) TaxID=436907 RepID=A7TFB6_VANPO|nr:uncharacterized protein Kpol_2000p109 [Vanderwaltozyma polyspora DSM 70294]EDO19141.1 hypothetical protein Kpol_2000p109 [Vanderwaltozyma polyspora DSM 70294]